MSAKGETWTPSTLLGEKQPEKADSPTFLLGFGHCFSFSLRVCLCLSGYFGSKMDSWGGKCEKLAWEGSVLHFQGG